MQLEVPFVRTVDNLADFFTKAFDAKKFHAMRRVIMNDEGCADGPRSALGDGERSAASPTSRGGASERERAASCVSADE